MLFRDNLQTVQGHPFLQLGKLCFAVLLILFRCNGIKRHESVKRNHRTRNCKLIGTGDYDYGCLINQGRVHLAGGKALPDQLVEGKLICGEKRSDAFRCIGYRGGPDCFMGVLHFLPVFIKQRFFRKILCAIIFLDQFPRLFDSLCCNPGRVCSHIGYQPDWFTRTKFDPLIELLS